MHKRINKDMGLTSFNLPYECARIFFGFFPVDVIISFISTSLYRDPVSDLHLYLLPASKAWNLICREETRGKVVFRRPLLNRRGCSRKAGARDMAVESKWRGEGQAGGID